MIRFSLDSVYASTLLLFFFFFFFLGWAKTGWPKWGSWGSTGAGLGPEKKTRLLNGSDLSCGLRPVGQVRV